MPSLPRLVSMPCDLLQDFMRSTRKMYPRPPPVKPYLSCSFGSVRASIAASTHSSASAPVEAVTPAAKAPSTKGASTRVTLSLFSEGSISRTVSAERTALPRSMKTSTSLASRSLMEASIRSGSVPKEPSASPPTAEISTSPAICKTRSAVPSAISLLCGIGRAPEHPGHAPSAGRLLRGLDGGFEGVDDRLVPHLSLAALLDAAKGGFQSFGGIFGRDLSLVPEGRRGAQEGGAVERACGPADLADQGHRDCFQYIGRCRRVSALQTFERGLEAAVHVVA